MVDKNKASTLQRHESDLFSLTDKDSSSVLNKCLGKDRGVTNII